MTQILKFPAILTLLIVLLVAPTILHAATTQNAPDDIFVTFETLSNPNASEEPYTLAVIKPRAKAQDVTRGNQVLAKALLSIANEWFFTQLLTRYKHAPPEELAMKLIPMKADGIHLTDKSSFLIVFKGSNLLEPIGTLWFYYPDENGKIDLQASLDSDLWKYPVPKTEFRNYPLFALENGVVSGVHSPRLLTGGVIEFKRLALDPKSPRELLTAMLMRGEGKDRLTTQTIRDMNSQKIFPAEYALRCNHALIPVYLRLGLEVVPNHPVNEANEDYVMRIGRPNYVKRTLKMLESARKNGWDLRMSESNLDHILRTDTHLRGRICSNLFAG